MNRSKPDIVMIGSGNVGFHVGVRLHQAGYNIKQVFSLTEAHGKSLAEKVSCSFTNDLSKVVADADVYLLCVKDDAMAEVLQALNINDKIVLHTAGSVPRKVSGRTDIHQGVLYPLQSFKRNADVSWENVPVFIDGDNDDVISVATQIGNDVSGNVQRANDQQRLLIHIAAVFANNFSNHCLAVGQQLLEENGFNFDVLKPLVETTFKRFHTTKPFDVQTGPAIRGDAYTVDKHLQALDKHENWKVLYETLSNDIKNTHKA